MLYDVSFAYAILWRVPAFQRDAEGLEGTDAPFMQKAFDISGIRDGAI